MGDSERTKSRRRLLLWSWWPILACMIWVRAAEVAVMALDHPVFSDEQEPSGNVRSHPEGYRPRQRHLRTLRGLVNVHESHLASVETPGSCPWAGRHERRCHSGICSPRQPFSRVTTRIPSLNVDKRLRIDVASSRMTLRRWSDQRSLPSFGRRWRYWRYSAHGRTYRRSPRIRVWYLQLPRGTQATVVSLAASQLAPKTLFWFMWTGVYDSSHVTTNMICI